MAKSLERFRHLSSTPADAIRWACILEATAPKVGNVYPGQSFGDLSYNDFITAAEIVSQELTHDNALLSQRMLASVQRTVESVGNNVNLGIVLLLGPLVAADIGRDSNDWKSSIAGVLGGFGPADGQYVFQAILAASPGGLGRVESNDVQSTCGPVDIVQAMTQAADRDRIARQYATGFTDLIENVVPVVRDAIDSTGDLLTGIARAHFLLLASEPDSLIARKCGHPFAVQVRDRAAQVNINDWQQVQRFDRWLRNAGNKRNPGTTADLIAASLYFILRSDDD